MRGPELKLLYAPEKNVKVENDGAVLRMTGFKQSELKYRATNYKLDEIRFHKVRHSQAAPAPRIFPRARRTMCRYRPQSLGSTTKASRWKLTSFIDTLSVRRLKNSRYHSSPQVFCVGGVLAVGVLFDLSNSSNSSNKFLDSLQWANTALQQKGGSMVRDISAPSDIIKSFVAYYTYTGSPPPPHTHTHPTPTATRTSSTPSQRRRHRYPVQRANC